MNFCTLIARRELAHARVLAASLGKHHPGSRLTTLVLDDAAGAVDGAAEPFDVVRPEELELPHFELATASCGRWALGEVFKPRLMRRLLAEAPEGPLIWLDARARLYAPLDPCLEALRGDALALTPSLLARLPDDDGRPGPVEAASWGAYDPGLIGLASLEGTGSMLDWWADASARLINAEDDENSSEVSWWYDFEADEPQGPPTPFARSLAGNRLDIAAGLAAGVKLISDPGLNTGYWNLADADVVADDDGYLIDDSRLRLFQFRGFDPDDELVLSEWEDRIELIDSPALRVLCADYAQACKAAGHDELASLSYGYAALPSGIPLTPRLRGLYREGALSGALTLSPFTEAGEKEFIGWLGEPGVAGEPAQVNRLVAKIYQERADLQRAIPSRESDFAQRLAEWAATSGRSEESIPDALLPGGANGEPPAAAPAAATKRISVPGDVWGANVVGFLRSDLGQGEAGRLLIDALDARRIPILPLHDLSLDRFETEGTNFATLGPEAAGFPINLMAMNGDLVQRFADRVPASFFAERYSIGLWFWETNRIPDTWRPAFELLDEVWVASDYVGEAVRSAGDLPVTKVRLPVRRPTPARLTRRDLGLPEDQFIFLYVFDYGSVGRRKNPSAVVEAFKRAFSPHSGASLVLKSSHGKAARGEEARVRLAAGSHPDIHFREARVSTEEKDALLAGCDCYVSLPRSEGFGLSEAEAMYLGKPLITTGYGGVLEFADTENSYLVDFEIEPVGEGHYPYAADDVWANPSVAHAAELMRKVFDDPEKANAVGRRGSEDIRRRHSSEASGETMERRLVAIRRKLRSEEIGSPEPVPVAAAPEVGPLRRLARRIPPFKQISRLSGRVEELQRQLNETRTAQRQQDLQLAALSAELLGKARDLDRRAEDGG